MKTTNLGISQKSITTTNNNPGYESNTQMEKNNNYNNNNFLNKYKVSTNNISSTPISGKEIVGSNNHSPLKYKNNVKLNKKSSPSSRKILKRNSNPEIEYCKKDNEYHYNNYNKINRIPITSKINLI
jgi:hypothetical protein